MAFDQGRPTTERRTAAILAADVVDYVRLMEADELDTHDRVKTHLRLLVDHGQIQRESP